MATLAHVNKVRVYMRRGERRLGVLYLCKWGMANIASEYTRGQLMNLYCMRIGSNSCRAF